MNTNLFTDRKVADHSYMNIIAERGLMPAATTLYAGAAGVWEKIRPVLLAGLFGLGIWQCVAMLVHWLRGIYFPTPLDCFISLWQMALGSGFLNHTIYEHVLASCGRWGLGLVLAWGCAIIWAFAAFWNSTVKALTKPAVEVLQLVPGLAWVPVAILLFGLGEAATITIIGLTTFPVVALAANMGFSSARPEHIAIGKACGYGFWGLFRTVFLPGAFPHILSGTRIALGVSWRVLVAAEMVVGSGEGLGYAIIQSRWSMDYTSAFACIVIIAVLGLALERLVLLPIERHTLKRWGMTGAKAQ